MWRVDIFVKINGTKTQFLKKKSNKKSHHCISLKTDLGPETELFFLGLTTFIRQETCTQSQNKTVQLLHDGLTKYKVYIIHREKYEIDMDLPSLKCYLHLEL